MEEKFRKPLKLKEQKVVTIESLIEYGKKMSENKRTMDYIEWVNSHPKDREELKFKVKEYDPMDAKGFIDNNISSKMVRCEGVDDSLTPDYERWHVNNTLFKLCKEGGMRSGEWDIPASVVVFYDELRELLYVGVPSYKFYGHLTKLGPMVHFFSDGTCFETTELVDMKSFLMVTDKEIDITQRYIKGYLSRFKKKELGIKEPEITEVEIENIIKDIPRTIHEHKLFDMEYYIFKGFKRNQKTTDIRAKSHMRLTKSTDEDFRKARTLGISCVYDPEQELSYLLTIPENMKKLGGDVHESGAIYKYTNYFKKCEGKEFRSPENLFEFILHKSNMDIFGTMIRESVDLWNRRFGNRIPEASPANLEDYQSRYTIDKMNELLQQQDSKSKI